MKFMNLKKKLAPVLMGGALAVATAVPVFASDAGAGTGLSVRADPRHDGPVLQQLEIEIPVGWIHLKMVHTDV